MNLRVFVIDENGDKVEGVPICLALEHSRGETTIAVLQSDHVGFLSFDVSEFASLFESSSNEDAAVPNRGFRLTELPATATMDGVAFKLIPLSNRAFQMDVTSALVVTEGLKPVLLSVPKRPSKAGCMGRSYPSVQNPTALDWRISPKSFFERRSKAGECGTCETLTLSQAAVRDFPIREVIFRSEPIERSQSDNASPIVDLSSNAVRVLPISVSAGPVTIGLGATHPGMGPLAADALLMLEMELLKPEFADVLEYRVRWIPQGHSLGEVVYSLPLAPCESVKIAMVEWEREDWARKSQSTEFSEAVRHELTRDRTVEETMTAAMDMMQTGTSVTAGASAGFGGFSANFGMSHSNQEASRDAVTNSNNRLADAVVQGGSAVRSFSSTVVTQVRQSERDYAQTRTVTNHNHCHAMTVLYYEVLRHFRVETSWERRTRVVVLPIQTEPEPFDEETAFAYRHVIRRVLLDRQLEEAIDALRIARHASEVQDAATKSKSTETVSKLVVSLKVIDMSHPNAHLGGKIVRAFMRGANEGTAFEIEWEKTLQLQSNPVVNSGVDGQTDQATQILSFELDLLNATTTKGTPTNEWSRVSEIGIEFSAGLSEHSLQRKVEIRGFRIAEKERILVDDVFTSTEFDPDLIETNTHAVSIAEVVGSATSDKDNLLKAQQLVAQLVDHLNMHADHYLMAMLLGDPRARRRLLARYGLHQSASLTPMVIDSTRIAFPTAEQPEQPDIGAIAHERIVSVPTRGVFAEAMLGNCNSCEVRDATRFWDWQESPCPEKAPEIAPVALGSRFQRADLQQEALPNGVLNIVNPPAGPAASSAGDLLRTLSEAALNDTTTAAALAAAQSATNARLSPRNVSDLKSIIDNSTLPDASKQELTESLLQSAIPSLDSNSGESTFASAQSTPTLKGSSPSAALARLVSVEKASPTKSLFWSFRVTALTQGLRKLVQTPESVDQAGLLVCGPAAFLRVWAARDPLAVVNFAIDLYFSGTAKFGDYVVNPGNHLMSMNYDKIDANVPEPATWMIMSALRDEENAVAKFTGTGADDGFESYTTAGEIEEWLEETGLYADVDENVNYVFSKSAADATSLSFKRRDVLAYVNSYMLGKKQFFKVQVNQIKSMTAALPQVPTENPKDETPTGNPNHVIVPLHAFVEVEIAGVDHVFLSCWTWGGTQTGLVRKDVFEKNYFGVISARLPPPVKSVKI